MAARRKGTLLPRFQRHADGSADRRRSRGDLAPACSPFIVSDEISKRRFQRLAKWSTVSHEDSHERRTAYDVFDCRRDQLDHGLAALTAACAGPCDFPAAFHA